MPIEVTVNIEDAKGRTRVQRPGRSGRRQRPGEADRQRHAERQGREHRQSCARSSPAPMKNRNPGACPELLDQQGRLPRAESAAGGRLDVAFTYGDVTGKGNFAAKFGAMTEADINLNVVRRSRQVDAGLVIRRRRRDSRRCS